MGVPISRTKPTSNALMAVVATPPLANAPASLDMKAVPASVLSVRTSALVTERAVATRTLPSTSLRPCSKHKWLSTKTKSPTNPTMIISLSVTTMPGTLACSMAVCATLDSAVSTAASSNAPQHTIPWTKRLATSTLSGNHGEPGWATRKLCAVDRATSVTRPVSTLLNQATPSLLLSGTVPTARVPSEEHSQHMRTTQLRNTPAMALLLAITAVVVAHATKALVSASVSPVSLVLRVKKSQIFSKYMRI